MVDLLIDIITWTYLVLVKPAANPAPLELVVQTAGEGLVRVVVADKAGVELKGPPDQRFDVGDEVLGDTSPAEEDLGILPCER